MSAIHQCASRRSRIRFLVAFVLASGFLLLGPTPVAAHAGLVSSDPAAESVVREPPEAVTLTYTEDVKVEADGIRVLDARGDRVDTGATSAEGEVVTAPLE